MIIKNKVKDTKVLTVEEFTKLNFNNLKDNKNRDIKKLKASIVKNGFTFPVYTWFKNDYCIDGKGRQLAIQELLNEGYTFESIPHVDIEAKDLEEAKQRVLEASSQYGKVTKESFISFAEDMMVDFDTVEIKGVDSDLLVESEDKDDEVPELPVEPKSKIGDLYELGEHRVLCGDSTKEEDVGRVMGELQADMVFTDPPWNVNYGADQKHPSWKSRTIENDHMETEDFSEFMNKTFAVMNKVSKVGALTYVVMSAQEWGNMMLNLKINNYHWSSTVIWANLRFR